MRTRALSILLATCMGCGLVIDLQAREGAPGGTHFDGGGLDGDVGLIDGSGGPDGATTDAARGDAAGRDGAPLDDGSTRVDGGASTGRILESCPGGAIPECTCRAGEECAAICPDPRGVGACSFVCEAGSVCTVTCGGGTLCQTECESGASCVVSCTAADYCTLTCGGSACPGLRCDAC